MSKLGSIFKTLAPRVIGAAVAGLASFIYAKTKGAVQVDPTTTTEIVTAMLMTYAAAHRAASAVINPGDAATGRIATGIDKAANDPSAPNTVVIPPKI